MTFEKHIFKHVQSSMLHTTMYLRSKSSHQYSIGKVPKNIWKNTSSNQPSPTSIGPFSTHPIGPRSTIHYWHKHHSQSHPPSNRICVQRRTTPPHSTPPIPELPWTQWPKPRHKIHPWWTHQLGHVSKLPTSPHLSFLLDPPQKHKTSSQSMAHPARIPLHVQIHKIIYCLFSIKNPHGSLQRSIPSSRTLRPLLIPHFNTIRLWLLLPSLAKIATRNDTKKSYKTSCY